MSIHVSAFRRRFTRSRAIELCAGAIALSSAPSVAFSQQLTPLRLGSPPDDNTGAALYGIQAGIFKKYGLDVSIQKMNSGAATAAAVVGGAIDIGKTSLVALLQAHQRGIPLLMVAGSGLFETSHPTSGFVVVKDGPIGSIPDLNGQTISCPSLGSIDQVAIEAWVAKAGGDSASLRFIELPTSAALAAVENNRVAGANVQNPVFADAQRNPKLRVLGYPFGVIANRFLLSAWFASQSYVSGNKETIRRFVRALTEATEYASAHPDATAPLLADYSGIKASVIEGMQRQPLTVALAPKEIEPVIDISVKYNLLKSTFPVADVVVRQ